jgi:hypothetical protein
VGRLERNSGTRRYTHCPRLPYPNKTKKSKENENFPKHGTDSEHQKAKDYSAKQHWNLNNSSTPRKTTNIQTFLQGLTPADSTDCSVWKVTKKTKQITKSSPLLRTPHGIWSGNNAAKADASLNT